MAPSAAKRVTREEWMARLKISEDKGDWTGVLQTAREWLKEPRPPFPTSAYFAEADALYKLGAIDEVIPSLNMLVSLSNPDSFPKGTEKREVTKEKWEIAQAVRRKFPNLKLQPLQFVEGESAREARDWSQKGTALLAAKNYDEIEATALSLQKSGAVTVDGSPHLISFFFGLLKTQNGGFPALQTRIAAWRAARPKSNLARLAAIQMWTDAAGEARGDGVASTVTSAMSAKIEAALQKGAQSWATLPKTAFESPLAFEVALRRVQLAGASHEFLTHLIASGIKKFPDYQPLYGLGAYLLLPRWFGAPGEAEAMIKARADQIGGENGDIFYGRLIWDLSSYVGQLSVDFNFDYERAQRGLKSLNERFPDSISIRSARFALAYLSSTPDKHYARDPKTLQEILIAPQGHIFDTSVFVWLSVERQKEFADFRMLTLGQMVK